MEIDLDNLVFNGLDEAEERNAERLDDADKKSAGDCRRRRLRRCLQDLIKKHRETGAFFSQRGDYSSGVFLNPVSISTRLSDEEAGSNW